MATHAQHTPAPPRIELFAAMRRHWVLMLLPIFLLVGAAVLLGLKRPAEYTTTAYLSVGHVYVDNPAGIPTILIATESLASAYSRAIDSGAVVADTKRRLGLGSSRLPGELSATPIPDSPLIRVTADASSARDAVELADAGAASLAAYTNNQIRDNDASGTLAARYRKAALDHREAVAKRDLMARRYEDDRNAQTKDAYDRAASAADTTLLRREALRASYQTAVQGGSTSIAVETFSRATPATSDEARTLQLMIFVGLIGGISLGAALALLRASRKLRRQRA